MTRRFLTASSLSAILSLSALAPVAQAASYATYTYSSVTTAGITRADFVQTVMGTMHLPAAGTRCFSDVGDQAFAYAVCGAKQLGIVTGDPSGRFRPNDPVTFVEAAAITLRANGEHFPYAPLWFSPYLARLAELNAIPLSVRFIYQPVSHAEATQLINAVHLGDDYDDNDNDEDEDEGDDLTLAVRASDSKVEPGDTVTYTIKITNDDNDDIEVDVTAELDDDMEIISISDDGDEVDDDEVEWDNVEIDEDDDVELKLKVKIDEDADDGDDLKIKIEADDASVSLTTEVDDDDDDDDDDDNDDDEVSVSISDSRDPADVGDLVTYRIELENHDENDDARVDVRAMLDDAMNFVDASHNGEEDNDEVEWDNIRVPEGETVRLTLEIRVTNDADEGDTIELEVETDDDEDTEETEIDDDNNNDDDNDDDEDISVTISDSPDPAEVGELITYRITVTNDDSDDVEVDVNAMLDDRTTLISASTGGEFLGDDEVEWDNLLVEGDDERVVLLTVRVKTSADDGDMLELTVEAGDDEDSEETEVQD